MNWWNFEIRCSLIHIGHSFFNSVLNVKALVGSFNQEKAFSGTISVIVTSSRTFVQSSIRLVSHLNSDLKLAVLSEQRCFLYITCLHLKPSQYFRLIHDPGLMLPCGLHQMVAAVAPEMCVI